MQGLRNHEIRYDSHNELGESVVYIDEGKSHIVKGNANPCIPLFFTCTTERSKAGLTVSRYSFLCQHYKRQGPSSSFLELKKRGRAN